MKSLETLSNRTFQGFSHFVERKNKLQQQLHGTIGLQDQVLGVALANEWVCIKRTID